MKRSRPDDHERDDGSRARLGVQQDDESRRSSSPRPRSPPMWPDVAENPWEAPLVIGVYSHKGGVGKTTLVLNLAAEYSRFLEGEPDGIQGRHNVLIVDCDPQCNTSSFLLDPPSGLERSHQHAATENDETDWNGDEESSDSLPLEPALVEDAEAILTRSRAAYSSSKLHRRAPGVTRIDPDAHLGGALGEYNENVFDLVRDVYEDNMALFLKYIGNATDEWNASRQPRARADEGKTRGIRFIIPGSPQIVAWESTLVNEHTQPTQRASTYFSAFRYSLMGIANSIGAGIVLVDLGPSAGMLNQMFAMSCDAIIPPLFPDRFSRASLEGMFQHVLPLWFRRHLTMARTYSSNLREAAHERNEARHYLMIDSEDVTPRPFGIPFKMRPPLICPVTVSCLRGSNGNIARLDRSTSAWILAFKRIISNFAAGRRGNDEAPRGATQDELRVIDRFAADAEDMVLPFTFAEPDLFAESQTQRRAMLDVPVLEGLDPRAENRRAVLVHRHRHLRVWIESTVRPAVDTEKRHDAEVERNRIRGLVERFRNN